MNFNIILDKFHWTEVPLETRLKKFADKEVINNDGKHILLRINIRSIEDPSYKRSCKTNAMSVIFQTSAKQVEEQEEAMLFQAVHSIPDDYGYFQLFGFMDGDEIKRLVIFDLKTFVNAAETGSGEGKADPEALYLHPVYNKTRTVSFLNFRIDQMYDIIPETFYYRKSFYVNKPADVFIVKTKNRS